MPGTVVEKSLDAILNEAQEIVNKALNIPEGRA